MKLRSTVAWVVPWTLAAVASPASAVCELPSCIQVQDALPPTGDLTADLQKAINDLLYPNDVLTTQPVVYFEPPAPGAYTLSDVVRICYDATPPIAGGNPATSGDCDGVAPQGAFPTVVTRGDWLNVTLRCVMSYVLLGDDAKQRDAWGCLHVGDAFVDATASDIGPVIGVDFATSPLRMTMESPGIWSLLAIPGTLSFYADRSRSMILCDGCTGSIGGHFTVGGDGLNLPDDSLGTITSQSIHAVGPGLRVTGTFDTDTSTFAFQNKATITFDGDVAGSGLDGTIPSDGVVVVDSFDQYSNGPTDGCKWGAYDEPCSGWSLSTGSKLTSYAANATAMSFIEWDDVHLDGEVDHQGGFGVIKGRVYHVKPAIAFNENGLNLSSLAHGSIDFTGIVRSRSVNNPGIRVFNSFFADAAFTPEIFLNGTIFRTGLRNPPRPEMGSAYVESGISASRGADVTIGPAFHYEGVQAGIQAAVGGITDRGEPAWLHGTRETALQFRAADSNVDVASLPLCVRRDGGGSATARMSPR